MLGPKMICTYKIPVIFLNKIIKFYSYRGINILLHQIESDFNFKTSIL